MVTVELQGGLGNQLFQISTGYAIAKYVGCDFYIDVDSSECLNQGNNSKKYADTVYKNIKKGKIPDKQVIYIDEIDFSYAPIEDLVKKYFDNNTMNNLNVVIRGYRQSYKYFKDVRYDILELYDFPDHYVDQLREFTDKHNLMNWGGYTVMHVRRGDYKKFPNHPIVPFTYYKSALKRIDGKNKLVIISDDIDHCKRIIRADDRVIFSDSNDELFDLLLLTQASNVIIGNSSFSWWGAYLNIRAQKVIAPMPWFKDNTNTNDLIPDNWEIVNYEQK